MIPQHQNVSVRRVLVLCPDNEVRKVLRFGHAGRRVKELYCLQLASAYKVSSYCGVIYPLREPALRSAGLHYKVKMLSLCCRVKHLRYIYRGHASSVLKIGAYHVLHDNDLLIV